MPSVSKKFSLLF